jgi:multiple sugar transport system substrate-binding protein
VTLSRRTAGAWLLGAGAGTCIGVCTGVRAQPAAPSRELVIASYPSLDEGVKVATALYAKVAPEVRLKLVSRSYGDHHDAMVTSLATGTSLPDVVGIEVSYLGRLLESGALEDLGKPPYNAQRHRDRIVPYTFAQASRRDGTLVAMPVDIGPGALLYRQDILAKAGVPEAQLGGSWEAFVETGKQIKARTGAVLVPNAQSIADVFLRADLKSGDGIFFDKEDRPLLNTPRFERAFALAKSVRDAGLDARIRPWTNEWTEGFRRGLFATEMSGAWLAGHLARYIAPKTTGLWRAAQLPGGAFASWGGSFYAIPRGISPERKALAWRFIEFLATDLSMQLAALRDLDAYPALLAAASDPFMDQPIEFLGGQRARQLWRDAAPRIPAIEVNRLDPMAREVITGELDKVLEGGKTIAAALRDAQRKVQRRVRR